MSIFKIVYMIKVCVSQWFTSTYPLGTLDYDLDSLQFWKQRKSKQHKIALLTRPESGLDWFGHRFDWPNSFSDLLGPDLGRGRRFCLGCLPSLFTSLGLFVGLGLDALSTLRPPFAILTCFAFIIKI